MKLKQIALAVAAACAAPAAFALTPADFDGTEVQLWISGATAPTASVFKGFRTLCLDADANGVPDDLHVYATGGTAGDPATVTVGSSAAGKFYAYACTLDLDKDGLADYKTILYHTADVGSFEAYTPHLYLNGVTTHPSVSSSVKRLKDIHTGAGNTCSSTTTTSSLGDPTYTGCGNTPVTVKYDANGDTVFNDNDKFATPTVPQGGFSDTEYTLNQLNLVISKAIGDIGSEQPSNIGQAFGVATSWPLYVTMQKSQGIIATLGANGETCDPTYSAGNDGVLSQITAVNQTPACQPNVSRQKYASVINVATVGDKDASVFGAAAGTVLKVERRVGTSGTQSSSNAYFLGQPCASGTPGGALTVAGGNLAGTVSYNGGKVLIRSNEGSGNVKTNLDVATNAGEMAIGILSMENAPNTTTEQFAWLKLDGVSPTYDNGVDNVGKNRQTSIDGDYSFWYELVGFTATTAFAEGGAVIGGIIGAWSDPAITDLRGIFPTAYSGATGVTVSPYAKVGNACSTATK